MADKINSISVFDNEVFVNGDIVSNGAIDIGGNLKGKVVANVLTIKSGGIITGDIYANEISLSNNGSVEGNIVANKIHLSKDSKFSGNLSYNIISIEDGAIFDGSCNKLDEDSIKSQIESAKNEISPIKYEQE